MAERPLSHLTVLDVSQNVAGPYCAKLMAEHGARVVKIERPGTGDRLRRVGPFFENREGPERSIPFLWLNMGKQGVTLDLRQDRGIELLYRLAERADVLIESWPPKKSAELGVSYEKLREVNPRLVVTSISNFGQSGPYRDYEAEEIVEYALAGLMGLTGRPERPPLTSGPATTQYAAGMNAYIATLIALFRRNESGEGGHVDLSIHESAMDLIEIALVELLQKGTVAKRKGNDHTLVPWQLFPCRNGWAAVVGGPIRHWLAAADMFEEPRLLEDRYRHMGDRMEHREEVKELLQPWLDRHDKHEVFDAGRARGLAFGYLAELDEVLAYPQHRAREFFVEVDHPEVGRHTYCGPVFRSNAFGPRTARAPLLGEHNRVVYEGMAQCSAEELQELREERVI